MEGLVSSRTVQLAIVSAMLTLVPLRASGQETADPQNRATEDQAKTDGSDTVPAFTEDIVVTATRTERRVGEVPISVTVVPSKQIEQAPAYSGDDLLREVPGLDLPLGSSAVSYPTQQVLSMRGLGGNRALVLMDGIPLNDPASGYVPWSKVSLLGIDHIEIARGAAASLFGNYALGGTIQLFSKSLDDHLEAQTGYGSYATARAAVSAAKRLGKGFAIGADINRFSSDGFERTPAAIRGPVDVPVGMDNSTVRLRTTLTAGKTYSFATGSFFAERLSLGTPLSKNTRDVLDLSVGTRVAMGSGEIQVTAFHQHQRFWVQNTSLIRRDSEFVLNQRTSPIRETGAAAQWSAGPHGRMAFFAAGVDLNHISLEERGTNYNSSGSIILRQTVGGAQDFTGVFAEAGITASPRLELLVGSRLDVWRNHDGFDRRNVGGDTAYSAQRSTELSPRAALRYRLSPEMSLRGAVYHAFRAPTVADLYRKTEAKAQVTLANPNLGPETLKGGDIGIDGRFGATTTTLNFFYNRIDGLIARVPLETSPLLIQRPVNIGTSRSLGIEAMASRAIRRDWQISAALTLTDPVTLSNPVDRSLEGKRTAGVSRHMETFVVRYQPQRGPAVTLRGRHIDKRYVEAANLLPLDAHVVIDLFASYPLTRSTEFFVTSENLFGADYLADVGAAQRLGAPRELFTGVRLRLPRHTN